MSPKSRKLPSWFLEQNKDKKGSKKNKNKFHYSERLFKGRSEVSNTTNNCTVANHENIQSKSDKAPQDTTIDKCENKKSHLIGFGTASSYYFNNDGHTLNEITTTQTESNYINDPVTRYSGEHPSGRTKSTHATSSDLVEVSVVSKSLFPEYQNIAAMTKPLNTSMEAADSIPDTIPVSRSMEAANFIPDLVPVSGSIEAADLIPDTVPVSRSMEAESFIPDTVSVSRTKVDLNSLGELLSYDNDDISSRIGIKFKSEKTSAATTKSTASKTMCSRTLESESFIEDTVPASRSKVDLNSLGELLSYDNDDISSLIGIKSKSEKTSAATTKSTASKTMHSRTLESESFIEDTVPVSKNPVINYSILDELMSVPVSKNPVINNYSVLDELM